MSEPLTPTDCWCDRLRSAGGGTTVQCPPCLARRVLTLEAQVTTLTADLTAERAISRNLAEARCDDSKYMQKIEAANASLRAELEALQTTLRELPHYAFDQHGTIYGPVDASADTFIRAEDLAALLAARPGKQD